MHRRILVIGGVIALPLLLVTLTLAFSTAATSVYATFLGAEQTERGLGIAVDLDGNAYVTGYTESLVFPTLTLPIEAMNVHGVDVFAARFNPIGTDAAYVIRFNALSALDEDYGYAVAVDEQGYAYIAGQTRSPDFCELYGVVPGVDPTYNGAGDAFLVKLNPDGGGLAYCTFLGGSDWDSALAVGVDGAGYAYVAGGTWSTDFVTGTSTINGQNNGLRDAFVLRVSPDGTAVEHASYVGGSGQEEVRSLAVTEEGVVTLTGWTNSSDFITTTGVIGPVYQGEFDAFVVKIDTVTPGLVYATYLGGAAEDRGYALAQDASGNTYVAGLTQSPDFPTTSYSYMPAPAGGRDGFVTKIDPAGAVLRYSTFLGGRQADQINGVALDLERNLHLTGETHSTNFPTSTNALSPTLPGSQSAFVAILEASGSELLYGSYLGGSAEDIGYGIALGGEEQVFVTGATRSADFPVSANAWDISHNGDYDIFVAGQLITVTSPLEADFTGSPRTGAPPLAVQFTNLSAGGYLTTTWDFGDGATSQMENPMHLFSAPGSYTVTLTIAGPDGVAVESRPGYVIVRWAQFIPMVLGQ